MADREEIIKAFVAKHGCGPDDVIQVEQRQSDFTTRWYVRLKDDADREMERRAKEIRERQVENMKTDRERAEADGFIVDTYRYPWFAYKGPRFAPIASKQIRTDAECAVR